MDTGEWLDKWLESRIVTPRTREKYSAAVAKVKEVVAFTDLADLTPELVDKATGGDPGLRSVLSMALGQAVKAGLISRNIAAVKREQRKPQEGSLYYRADRKAWVAQVTLTENGRRVVRTRFIKVDRKTKNPPDAAIKALEELKARKTNHEMLQEISTVRELVEKWLAAIRVRGPNQGEGIAPATYLQYTNSSHNQIIPMIGHVKVKDLTRVRVDQWLRDLEQSTYARANGTTLAYSANTVRLARNALRMAYKWAVHQGIVSSNVVHDSQPPGGRPRPTKYAMSEDQASRLIESSRGSNYGALWAVLITTGLRRGEALGLRWSDFDGKSITITSQIKVENGRVARGDLKTDKSRRKLVLPDYLIADLDAHRERQRLRSLKNGIPEPALIFATASGRPIHPSNVRDHFSRACKKAGIEPHEDGRPWTVHELRHTAASQLLNDRVPMQVVSRTLGHSSIVVTMDVYAHLTDQDSELAAESMARRYGSKRGD